MARFCFVSFAQHGHCDFGGMSFVRTAQVLRHRGHDVRWVFSRNCNAQQHAHALEFVKSFGIPVEDRSDFLLTMAERKEDILSSSYAFEKYITSTKYDCVVVDRYCVGAAFASHAACIPWAVVGTDGREWSFKRLRLTLHRAVLPEPRESSKLRMLASGLCREGFPKPSVKSNWATSPFLNISFFPRAYYEDWHHASLPTHSHFMGSGQSPDPIPVRKQLLITFGNTFDSILRRQIVGILPSVLRTLSIPTLVLTGEESMTKILRDVFQGLQQMTVKTWVPYDEAYKGARVAVGHGGTAHIWYGMREGTPLLAVSLIGDQLYGGFQLERLNIGRAVLPWMCPGFPPRVLRKLGKIGIRFSKREFVKKLHDVLTDEAVLESSLRLSRAMRTGGGVEGSAALLERLALERECVSTCVAPVCCC